MNSQSSVNAKSMVISFDVGLANTGLCIAFVEEGSCVPDIVHWDIYDTSTRVGEEASAVLVDILKKVFKTLRDSLNTWVLIERQCPENIKCMCLSHAIFSFFLSRFDNMHVSFVNAASKPLHSHGRKRKRESIDVVLDMLETEKNTTWLAWLKAQKKKDDLCDAYLQIVGNIQNIKYVKEKQTKNEVIEILD